eukprot:6789893-Pyramimonas_sp.AAC.1
MKEVVLIKKNKRTQGWPHSKYYVAPDGQKRMQLQVGVVDSERFEEIKKELAHMQTALRKHWAELKKARPMKLAENIWRACEDDDFSD